MHFEWKCLFLFTEAWCFLASVLELEFDKSPTSRTCKLHIERLNPEPSCYEPAVLTIPPPDFHYITHISEIEKYHCFVVFTWNPLFPLILTVTCWQSHRNEAGMTFLLVSLCRDIFLPISSLSHNFLWLLKWAPWLGKSGPLPATSISWSDWQM